MPDPWYLKINGVDHTHDVLVGTVPQLVVSLNERATLSFAVRPGLLPNRFDDVLVSYDGINPAFRGLILKRSISSLSMGTIKYSTRIDCGDYATTSDWCFATLDYSSYTSGVSVYQVLSDLVGDYLSTFGVQLEPTQVNPGPILAPFAWKDKRVSDCIREMCDKTGWVARVSPYKTLGMIAPGTEAAAYTITDADPHCQDLTWADTDKIPANNVILTCGPTTAPSSTPGLLETFTATANGTATSWVFPGAGVGSYPYTPEGGGSTILVGSAVVNVSVGIDQYHWESSTATLSVGSWGGGAPPSAGTIIWFQRSFQYPLIIRAATGETPVITYLAAAPDVMTWAAGQQLANGILAQLDQQPRDISIISNEPGWIYSVGCYVSITLTGRLVVSALITDFSVGLVATSGATLWHYQIRALENTIFQGSVLDSWRALLGSSNSSSPQPVISGGGGGGGGGGSVGGTPGHLAKFTSPISAGDATTYEDANNFLITAGQNIQSTSPVLKMTETDAATDQKLWQWVADGGLLYLQTINDAGNAVLTTPMRISRSGLVQFNGDLTALGNTFLNTMQMTGALTGAAAHFSGNLIVTGSSSLDGGATISGLSVIGNSLLQNTTVGTLTVPSGQTTLAATQINGNLVTNGTATFQNTISQAAGQAAYLSNTSASTLAVSGQASFSSGVRFETGSSIYFFGTTIAGHLIPSTTDLYDIGSPTKLWRQGYLSQLNAIVFNRVTQTLFGGYSTVGKNAGAIVSDVTAGATTIDFGQTMTPGDFVLIRATDTSGTIKGEYLQIGSLQSGTTYFVTRDLAGSYAPDPAWAGGTPYLVLGTTGDGRIDLLAFDGRPRILFVEQGSTYNAQTLRGVIGNLNGYYGYGSSVYGTAFGAETGSNLTIDPSNGLRIRYGSTVFAQMSSSLFTLGIPSGNRVTWDGSELSVITSYVTINNSGIVLQPANFQPAMDRASYRFANQAADTGVFGLYGLMSVTGSVKRLQLQSVSTTAGGQSGLDVYLGDSSGSQFALQLDWVSSAANFRWNGTAAQFLNGLRERNRTTPLGDWIDIPYNASDFFGDVSMIWTVEAGDVAVRQYSLSGRTLTVRWGLVGTTIGGTVAQTLVMKIPGGYTAAAATYAPFVSVVNGVATLGLAFCNPGGVNIGFLRADSTNWSASTNGAHLYGSLIIAI